MNLKKSVTNLLKLNNEEITRFFKNIDTVLTDCDGVLWNDKGEIEGSAQVMNKLRQMGKQVYYITNNSTKPRKDIAKKAEALGFIAEENDIISTSHLTTLYLKEINFNKKVYLLGSYGLSEQLNLFGINNFGPGPDIMCESINNLLQNVKIEENVGAVVVGFDEHISYPKMLKAATYLIDPKCLFIATNTDERFPTSSPLSMPGTGTFVRAIETVSGRKPDIIIGKPHKFIRKCVLDNYKVDPTRTLMIGDRCNTDILFGSKCDFYTMLVMSGVTDAKDLEQLKTFTKPEDLELVPDIYVPKLGDILNYLN